MTNDELQASLLATDPTLIAQPGGEWLNLYVESTKWHALAMSIRHVEPLLFDYLFCLTCIDWKTQLCMVYHLSSTRWRHQLVIKSTLDRTRPEINTVSTIWKTADFHEREVAELFGVHFRGHPDLRNLILPDNWTGFPLRKDYEDPVNMIKL